MRSSRFLGPAALILGGGALAQALDKRLSLGGRRTVRAGKKPGPWHLDLARDSSCWRLPPASPWVFVCAGITSRKNCADHPHATRRINVTGGLEVAEYFSRLGSQIVFFGTDLVPDDGEYARQKEDLRLATLALPGVFWVRLGKVIHRDLPVMTDWRMQAGGGVVKAWKDGWMRPMTPEAVAEACALLLETKEFLPKEMDWNLAQPMTYAELASRWVRFTGPAGPVEIQELPSPFQSAQISPRICPDPFRRLLMREDRRAWWNL